MFPVITPQRKTNLCSPRAETFSCRRLPPARAPDWCPVPICAQGDTAPAVRKPGVPAAGRSSYTQEESLVCLYEGCAKVFTQASKLTAHRRSHTREKSWVCLYENCEKRFVFKSSLEVHLRIHSKEKPYICVHEGCGRSFASVGNFKRHQVVHVEEKTFICPWDGCGCSFAASSRLARHLHVHSAKKPFVCSQAGCGRAFSQMDDLKRHRRTHTGEKPFACRHEGCGRLFADASSRARHLRVHTRQAPFVCLHEGCGRSFTQSNSLKRHQEIHTRDTPPLFVNEGAGHACAESGARTRHLLARMTKPPLVAVRGGNTGLSGTGGKPHGYLRTSAENGRCFQRLETGPQPLARAHRRSCASLPVAQESARPLCQAVAVPTVPVDPGLSPGLDHQRAGVGNKGSWPTTAVSCAAHPCDGSALYPDRQRQQWLRAGQPASLLPPAGSSGALQQMSFMKEVKEVKEVIPGWLRSLADECFLWSSPSPSPSSQGTDASGHDALALSLADDDKAFWRELISPAGTKTRWSVP